MEELNGEKNELLCEIKELESRPVEVTCDTTELNRRLEEVSVRLQNESAQKIAEERQDFSIKLNQMENERDGLENKISDLEKQLREAQANGDPNTKTFVVKMTLDEYKQLLDLVKGNKKLERISKTMQILHI